MGKNLFPAPGHQHVFLAQFAGVLDQCESQILFVSAAEFVNAWSIAAFRLYSAGPLKRHGIARHRVSAPRIAFAVLVKIGIERAVSLDHPNGAEGVRPCPDERRLPRLRIGSAGVQQHE